MKLKIDKDNFVFLFLGKIEPYKGVENLIKAFSELDLPATKLIIAGKCLDINLWKNISKYDLSPNIIINNRFIPAKDIQLYLNASDIVVYPFDSLTTSGSIFLALSFRKSIIYPKIGNLKELPNNIGYSYDHGDPDGLKQSLYKAKINEDKIHLLDSNAYKYAKKLNWNMIANGTVKIYSELIK